MLLAQIQMIKTKRESQNFPAGAWVIYCDTLQSNAFRLPLFYQLLFLDRIEKRGIHAEATLFETKCKCRNESLLHDSDASSEPLLILDACCFNSMSKELGTFSKLVLQVLF